MSDLSPKAILAELNRYIIGQEHAKRRVAVSLRNRWRRAQLATDLRSEIVPKNILMVGPTGVGKTEIARRLAKISDAPFVKVEATKFTEVGYVGRDVDQIIRDLLDVSILLTKQRLSNTFRAQAHAFAEEKLLEALVSRDAGEETKARFREKMETGLLEDALVDIEVPDAPAALNLFDIPGSSGVQASMLNLGDLFSKAGTPRTKVKTLPLKEARSFLIEEKLEELMDKDDVVRHAIEALEQRGIVFIDEIDKICSSYSHYRGGEVSREGVQRDLLPLLEGTVVSTKHGPVKTDYILFIASGAFHQAKPSDMLPELQGRLPVRVDLHSLKEEDFCRILREKEFNLINQTQKLLETEGVILNFTEDAIRLIAKHAYSFNQRIEDLGARRLQGLIEHIIEEISFDAPDRKGEEILIDESYVQERIKSILSIGDIERFIL